MQLQLQPQPTLSTNSASSCYTPQTNLSDFDRKSWIISVGLAIAAALINNLGLNLQKLAWTKRQDHATPINVYYSVWGLGMVLIVLASVCDFVALAFGPQSVIAPLGSLTMVVNAFIAPYMHGEKLQPGIVFATSVIVLGCLLAVMSASHINNICDLDALFSLYWTTRFLAYALLVFVLVSSLYGFIRRCERIKQDFGIDSQEYNAVLRFHRISYAALSGIFGSQSVLFARTITQAFNSSLRFEERLFLLEPALYLVFFMLVLCILLQIYWLNRGLELFESLYNVPVFTSTWIVGTVLGGGVFYGEFSGFSLLQAVCFPSGILLCCVGVFFLSQHEHDDKDNDNGDNDEETVSLKA